MANIKQIKASNNTVYDIQALHFRYVDGEFSLDSPADWKTYIDQIGELGFEIKKLNSLPAANAQSYELYHNSIILIPDSGDVEEGNFIEYIILRDGEIGAYTYAWEVIGNTKVDLSDYVTKTQHNAHTHSVTVPTISQTAKKLSITKATPESVSVVPSYTPSMGKLGTTSVVPAVANGTASKATAGTAKDVAKAGTAVSFDGVGTVSSGSNFLASSDTITEPVNLVTGISAEANDTSTGGIAVVTAAKGAASLTGTKTFVTGVKSTNNGSAVVTNVTGNTAVAVLNSASLGSAAEGAGDMDVVTNVTGAISGASLSASSTSTDGPKYVEQVAISTTQFNTDAIKSVTLSNDGVSGTNPAYIESITGSISGTFAEDGISAVTLSNDGVSGTDPKYIEDVAISTTQFNTDAIKSASLSENDSSATGRLQYLKDVTISATEFNTDAIKDITLSASATSTDGPGYVESITYSDATTDAIKSATPTENGETGTGRIQYLKDASLSGGSAGSAASITVADTFATVVDEVLSFDGNAITTDAIKGVTLPTLSKTTKYLGISTAAANVTASKITAVSNKYMKHTNTDASKSAPSLTKTTKYMGISTTAAGKSAPTLTTKTVKYMKVNTTAATTAGASLNLSPVTKYMKATGTAAGKSAPTLTTNTTKYMKITTASSGVTVSKAGAKLTTGTTNVLPGITVTKNDFNTGTVGISNADATTKYLHISDTHISASKASAVTDVAKVEKSIVPAVSNGTITPYTFADVTVAKVGTAVSVVNGISADSTGNIVMGITGATAVDVAKPMEAVTGLASGATGDINFVESLTIGSTSATSSVPSPQLS